jgi:hypothetical protein
MTIWAGGSLHFIGLVGGDSHRDSGAWAASLGKVVTEGLSYEFINLLEFQFLHLKGWGRE